MRQIDGMRYEIRLLQNGWAVWDTMVNAPAVVGGRWQVDLGMDDADDLASLLNDTDAGANAAVGSPGSSI
jgi:hypothetical protein